MNTSFDITDIDCVPKELEDALGVSGRTLFDPSEHPIHVDIWDGKAYVTLAEMIELEGDALRHFLAIVFPVNPSIVRRFGFEACVRIPVGGHVIVLRMRGDAIHQVIRDLELALAGGVGSCGIAAQGAGE